MLSQPASADKLSQHAVAQSQAREARNTIPACIVLTSYSSMQSPNRPGKQDMLSQHAVTHQGSQKHYLSMHRADRLSQHALQNMHCIKEAAKAQNTGQADKAKYL